MTSPGQRRAPTCSRRAPTGSPRGGPDAGQDARPGEDKVPTGRGPSSGEGVNQRHDANIHRIGSAVCLPGGRRPATYQINAADTAGRKPGRPGAQTRVHGGVLWRPCLDVRAGSVS